MSLQKILRPGLKRVPRGYRELLEEMRKIDYLRAYVERISRRVGIPDYYPTKLPNELKKASWINIIYPVGNGIYIHVYMPPEGTESGYRKYIVIEPPKPPDILFDLIEEKMAELITEKHMTKSIDQKEKVLLEFLNKIVTISNNPVNYLNLIRRRRNNLKRIPVYRADFNRLRYYLIRDKTGLGILEPFIRDPYIEDISCDGVGYVFIVHKIFGSLETSIKFETEQELDRFVIELSERIGKPVSHARPIVDATLPDGSRINIVFGKDVSLHGSNFTIRKFSKKPISIVQLIKWGTLDERIGAYLWILLLEGMSGWISGETASGKTTTLNAIITFIKPTSKIITIEDTAEVQVPHKNWVRELTRDTGSVESSVTMFDLLKAALRQRPNYIIVGEIRGAEGNVAFQAMQTGHPVLSTFHAGSVERLIQRVTSPPINVPKTQLDNLNFIIIQSAVYREGIMLRRMISVNEILGYDADTDSIVFIPVFTWDPTTDRFLFRGKGASYLLEEKIATMRGITRRNIKLLYEELELRAQILKEMVKRNIVDYYDVFRIIARVYNIVEEMSRGKKKEETQYVILDGLRYCLKMLRMGMIK